MGKKKRRAPVVHLRRLVDPATLDRRGGPYQLWKTATSAGFEVLVAETPTLGVVTVGGLREDDLGFNAHWREGAVSSVRHSRQGLGPSSVTRLKAWLREVESDHAGGDAQGPETMLGTKKG